MRRMISCFRGLCPISMPEEWLAGFDIAKSFATLASGEAAIRFPNGKAFALRVEHNGPEVSRTVRALSTAEQSALEWGKFGPPWETHDVAKAFGHGPITALDTL